MLPAGDVRVDAPAATAAPTTRLITPTFVAVTAAALAFFVYVGVLVPLVPMYVEDDLRGGELGVGLAVASFAGAAVVGRPAIGRLIERFGRRAVMVGGGLIAGASGALYGYADSLPAFLLLRGASGIGEAALFVGAATLIADLCPPNRRAEGASYFSVAVYAGVGVGPILGEIVMDRNGITAAFLVAGAFAVLAAAISLALPARVRPQRERDATPAGDAGGLADDHLEIDIDQTRRHPFVHRAALGPGVVLAIGMAAFASFTAFVPDYSRSLGMSGSGGLFAAYSITCLVLRVAGARIPERIGPRRSVTSAFAALGVALTLLAAVPATLALWVAAPIVGVGAAFLYPSLMALTVDRASERERPRAVASFTMFFEIGTAAGGLALGAIADATSKRAAFGLALTLCALGIWVVRARVMPRPQVAAVARIDPIAPPAGGVAPAGSALVPVAGE